MTAWILAQPASRDRCDRVAHRGYSAMDDLPADALALKAWMHPDVQQEGVPPVIAYDRDQ
jgi:hypothetical protein